MDGGRGGSDLPADDADDADDRSSFARTLFGTLPPLFPHERAAMFAHTFDPASPTPPADWCFTGDPHTTDLHTADLHDTADVTAADPDADTLHHASLNLTDHIHHWTAEAGHHHESYTDHHEQHHDHHDGHHDEHHGELT